MRKVLALTLLGSIALLIACNRSKASYRSSAEVATAMTQETEGRRFDRAIQIGQEWLSSHPDDSVHYHQSARLLFLRASIDRDPRHKRELLERASDYFEKSVRAEPHDPITVLNAALGFEGIANLSFDNDRCGYYVKAGAALKRMEPLLVGNEYVLKNGQTIAVAPLRTEHDRRRSKLSDEMEKARCR